MEMEIISKSLGGTLPNEDEIAQLFSAPLFSRESAMILSAAREKSEPVGSEHTIEELVEKTIVTREAKPVYSGSAKRIPSHPLLPTKQLKRAELALGSRRKDFF